MLTDGNQRYSVFKRLGKTSYYTIVWRSRELSGSAREIMMERGWLNGEIAVYLMSLSLNMKKSIKKDKEGEKLWIISNI